MRMRAPWGSCPFLRGFAPLCPAGGPDADAGIAAGVARDGDIVRQAYFIALIGGTCMSASIDPGSASFLVGDLARLMRLEFERRIAEEPVAVTPAEARVL